MPYYEVTVMLVQQVKVGVSCSGKEEAERVAGEVADGAIVQARTAGSDGKCSYSAEAVGKPVAWETEAKEAEPPKPTPPDHRYFYAFKGGW